MDDLVERNGLYYYKQFTDVLFTGKLTGGDQESFKNGKKEGIWVVGYYDNGQVMIKGNFKNGKHQGAWVEYHKNGKLKSKSNYKNGKEEGASVYYWDNGELQSKGNYKNGKKEGAWVGYMTDGNVFGDWTGTYKDGVKVSD